MIEKNLVLFFTMKVLLLSARFFNSMQDEILPNQESPSIQQFFPVQYLQLVLTLLLHAPKYSAHLENLLSLLSASFFIVALDFEQRRHEQSHLICTLLNF